MQKEVNLDFLLEYVFETEGIKADKYDIFLAHDLENEKKLEEKLTLYNAIGAVCERFGYKPFIPFRFFKSKKWEDLNFEWGDLCFRNKYTLLHGLMIPNTKLFLCDLTTPSQSIKEMKNTAIRSKKPQIYFYEKGRIIAEGYANLVVMNNNNVKGILKYSTIRGCIKTLEAVIKANF